MSVEHQNYTKKSFLTALTSISIMLASFITAFFVTPVLVSLLGAQIFGLWRVVLNASSYMSFSDLGGSNALKWTIAKSNSSTTDIEKRKSLTSVFIVWCAMFPIVSLLVLLATMFVSYFYNPDVIGENEIKVVVAVMMFSFAFFCLASIPSSLLRGENMEFKALALNVLTSTLPLVLGGFAVFFGFGIVGLASAHFIATLIVGGSRAYIAVKHITWLGFAWPRKSELIRNIRLGLWFTAWNFVVKILEFSDVILIGVLIGSQFAAKYSLTQFLIISLLSFVFGIMGSILPSIGKLIGGNETKKLHAVRQQARGILWILVTICLTVGVVVNELFISVWVGNDMFLGGIESILLIILTCLMAFLRFETTLIDASLDIKKKTNAGLISVVVMLPFAAFLGKYYGVVGVISAYIVNRILLIYYFNHLVRDNILKSEKNWLKENFRYLIFSLIVVIAVNYMFSAFTFKYEWIDLLILSAGTIFSSGALFLLIGISPEVRLGLFNRFRYIFGH